MAFEPFWSVIEFTNQPFWSEVRYGLCSLVLSWHVWYESCIFRKVSSEIGHRILDRVGERIGEITNFGLKRVRVSKRSTHTPTQFFLRVPPNFPAWIYDSLTCSNNTLLTSILFLCLAICRARKVNNDPTWLGCVYEEQTIKYAKWTTSTAP